MDEIKKKTMRERNITCNRIEEMREEYEDVVVNKRWDKELECYVNREGEPIVHQKEIVYNDILALIPLSGEFYSKREKDKNYEKNLKKLVRDVMTEKIRRRYEERMNEKVEKMVDELKKKAVEEVKAEAVKV
ncbi:hypothetical protein Hanom_Chr07g00647111 [Helianthus anomalus]